MEEAGGDMNDNLLNLANKLSDIYHCIYNNPSTARSYSAELSEIKSHPLFESHILPRAIEISKERVEKW